jgi:hypothetical protein
MDRVAKMADLRGGVLTVTDTASVRRGFICVSLSPSTCEW